MSPLRTNSDGYWAVSGSVEVFTVREEASMKIARFKLYGSKCIVEHKDHMDKDPDWIRLTESVEVEFTDLPPEQTIPPQIDLIDATIATLRAETAEKIGRLEDEKAKLLAITHQPNP